MEVKKRAERSKCSCKFYPETEANKLQFLIPYPQILLFLEKCAVELVLKLSGFTVCGSVYVHTYVFVCEYVCMYIFFYTYKFYSACPITRM